MPPKKPSAAAPSKKNDIKKKEKLVEDKTFGLKNKKGNKNQKFIANVTKAYIPPKKDDKSKLQEAKKKELEELNQMFRPVAATQKIEKGVNPKSVVCAFFKQGSCTKGDKCKFSHDLTLERKAVKKNVYEDVRQEDNMEDWDEEKLKEVVEKKHGERERKMPQTDIICRNFIEALENSKYGWFWECPSGGDKCHYRHALPPGFVLNKDKKKDKKDDISIEDLVEKERANVGYDCPKITLESFIAWKKRKITQKRDRKREDDEKKLEGFYAGRHVGLSGRDMFTFDPKLVGDEDDMEEGESTVDMRYRDDGDESSIREIDLEALSRVAQEVDERKTELMTMRTVEKPKAACSKSLDNDEAVPIDENLFADDDPDLDDLDDEFSDLSVN